MNEKTEDLKQALITYHLRFQNLCGKLNKYTLKMNEFLAGSAHLPPEFHADFKPIFMKFAELYLELGECMEDIGSNGQEWFNWFEEYTDNQQLQINILNQMVKNAELINEFQEETIESMKDQLKSE